MMRCLVEVALTMTSTKQAPGLVAGSYVLDATRLQVNRQQSHAAAPLGCQQHKVTATYSMRAGLQRAR